MTADYQKKNKNDISLTAGDLVDVIERNDYGKNSFLELFEGLNWVRFTEVMLKFLLTFSGGNNNFLHAFRVARIS